MATITGRTDRQTDRRTDRVRRNMRPPPREEGRIIIIYRVDLSQDHSRALYASTTGLPKHWRKRPGRSRHTWLRTIENDLRPLNLGLATGQRHAQNRTAWQTLVETATSLTSSRWWWWWRWWLLSSAAVQCCKGRFTNLIDWLIDWLK